MSPSRINLFMESYLPDGRGGSRIATKTNAVTDGDTPHEKDVAGITGGMIGQGISASHSNYLSSKEKGITYKFGIGD